MSDEIIRIFFKYVHCTQYTAHSTSEPESCKSVVE